MPDRTVVSPEPSSDLDLGHALAKATTRRRSAAGNRGHPIGASCQRGVGKRRALGEAELERQLPQ
jgi:hypothetical protein